MQRVHLRLLFHAQVTSAATMHAVINMVAVVLPLNFNGNALDQCQPVKIMFMANIGVGPTCEQRSTK